MPLRFSGRSRRTAHWVGGVTRVWASCVSRSARARLPEALKRALRPIAARVVRKDAAELSYWRDRLAEEGRFENSHYERLMLAMAGEPTAAFLAGKVVADFGCGPRGSLVWARSSARLRIGIDVLADQYADEFTADVLSHGMVYVTSTEHVIPLPSGLVDVMFTLNAMDHVDNLSQMCLEIVRVIKPGGLFIGSFNLEEPASPAEPQRLSEALVEEHLLRNLEVETYRVAQKTKARSLEPRDVYAPFFSGNLSYTPGAEGYLWVRARKPPSPVPKE